MSSTTCPSCGSYHGGYGNPPIDCHQPDRPDILRDRIRELENLLRTEDEIRADEREKIVRLLRARVDRENQQAQESGELAVEMKHGYAAQVVNGLVLRFSPQRTAEEIIGEELAKTFTPAWAASSLREQIAQALRGAGFKLEQES